MAFTEPDEAWSGGLRLLILVIGTIAGWLVTVAAAMMLARLL